MTKLGTSPWTRRPSRKKETIINRIHMTSSPKAGLLPGGTEFGTEQRLKNALRQDSGSNFDLTAEAGNG